MRERNILLSSRRTALLGAAALSVPVLQPPLPAFGLLPPLSPRLDASSLTPLASLVPSVAGELRYPSWMLGTWRVTNTVSSFTMPLGDGFVDAFTRAVAEDDVSQATPITYTLRFVPAAPPADDPTLCVAQDRRFNAIEETNAFLGGDGGEVRGATYEVSAAHPHGRLLLEVVDPPEEQGGRAGGGASPTVSNLDIAFEWARWDRADSGAFVTSELVRQRSRRPPSTYEDALDEESFLEILTSFKRVPPPKKRPRGASPDAAAAPPEVIRVRNRLVQYLELRGVGDPPVPRGGSGGGGGGGGGGSSGGGGGGSGEQTQIPASRLAARERSAAAMRLLAAGRATSFFDYDWRMERVEDTPTDPLAPRTPLGDALGSPRFT
jgi:hypothetical protein